MKNYFLERVRNFFLRTFCYERSEGQKDVKKIENEIFRIKIIVDTTDNSKLSIKVLRYLYPILILKTDCDIQTLC